MMPLQHKFFANQAVVRRYVGAKDFWFSPLKFGIEIIRNYEKLGFFGVIFSEDVGFFGLKMGVSRSVCRVWVK
ncbi:hypothetical protein LCGC14_2512480 [marine sediment metagenome]|uniref:Uncharacterized protein n=1 Tax=marine sediment metagenome TaxID=412755 RepID=A0A0F9AZF4_9ZZZZ